MLTLRDALHTELQVRDGLRSLPGKCTVMPLIACLL